MRIQPMSADSAQAIVAAIKSKLDGIASKSADGLSRHDAIALENLYYASSTAHTLIVEGKAKPLATIQLPAEDLGAKNQSDWEGQQLAAQLRPAWIDDAMVIGQKSPACIGGIPIA